jgi:hypothetical protein
MNLAGIVVAVPRAGVAAIAGRLSLVLHMRFDMDPVVALIDLMPMLIETEIETMMMKMPSMKMFEKYGILWV